MDPPAEIQEKPIPLIQFEGDKFRITEEAINFLMKLNGPVGVITIIGKYRTGKSLFLNKVLLNNNNSFRVCPTINSCTKGLWISRQIIKSDHPEAADMDVLVIDSEGFGAMEETDAYNNRILLFALLLSSYFIYNSVGSIDEKSLNNLNVITNLAKELQTKNLGNDKIEEQFPTFMWIVRDFTLRLVDSNGCIMEPKEYLEYALEIQKGISDAVQNKNKIRRMIKHFFRQRDCFTLVTPVENQDDLQKLNSLPNQALRPEFVEQIQVLRQKILKRVKPKKLKNKKLTGQTLIQLATTYIQAINNGSLPNIQSAWKSLNRFQINKTVGQTKEYITSKFTQFSNNLHPEDSFAKFEEQLVNQSLSLMKKRINNQSDLESNMLIIKQFVNQLSTNAKTKNKKKALEVLIRHFQDQSEECDLDDSIETLQKKWKDLQHLYRTQFKQNPCLQQFFIDHLFPNKFEVFTSRLRRQSEKIKSEQSEKSAIKELYEKRLKKEDEAKRELEFAKHESERQLALFKARSDEQIKIKAFQMTYLEKELNETKQKLNKIENLNEELAEQLEQRSAEIVQLNLKLNGASFNLKELQDDKGYKQKQLQILKNQLNQKLKQIDELKKINHQLRSEIEGSKERQKSLQYFSKNQIQTKSEQFESLLAKYQSLQKQNMNSLNKITKLQSSLQFESSRLLKQEKLFQAMLDTLKNNYETERQHTIELTEANRNMAFALKHLEQRFQQAEQKEKKMKEFKKCVKNSSCMQCQNCSKFFVPAIFPQHLNICILGPESFKKAPSDKPETISHSIEIEVKQTLLKDSESKPYTEYLLQIKKGQKSWRINRKYKDFCSLHNQLKILIPGINFSDHSYIVNPQQGAKKCLLVQQRRKILEKYLRDLSSNPHISQEAIWKQFIQDTDTESSGPITNESKLAVSELRSQIQNSKQDNSAEKENYSETNRNHKTPEQFLRIWNERNLRAKQVSKTKKIKN